MTQHFLRNTVSVSEWCKKCHKYTQHRVDDARKGPCLECIARLEREHKESVPQPKQGGLFS